MTTQDTLNIITAETTCQPQLHVNLVKASNHKRSWKSLNQPQLYDELNFNLD